MGTKPEIWYIDWAAELDGDIQGDSAAKDVLDPEGTMSRDWMELGVRELVMDAIDGADLRPSPKLIWR